MTNSNHVSALDISAKWSKVTESEAAAIRNVDSLLGSGAEELWLGQGEG